MRAVFKNTCAHEWVHPRERARFCSRCGIWQRLYYYTNGHHRWEAEEGAYIQAIS